MILLSFFSLPSIYTLYLGWVLPAKKSAACETIGRSKATFNPGICRATVSTVGKKLPNKFKKPKASILIPINPHRIITNAIPRKKQIVPRIRSRLGNVRMDRLSSRELSEEVDNHTTPYASLQRTGKCGGVSGSTYETHLVNSVIVRLIPIAKHKPIKNNVLPIAIKEASKKSMTPKRTKPNPKQMRPMPIFWLSSNTITEERLCLTRLLLFLSRKVKFFLLFRIPFLPDQIPTMRWELCPSNTIGLLA